MVTKSRLDSLIGQHVSATAKTATREVRKLADEQQLFYAILPCGENDSAPVFECKFGTYKTKVIFF